MTMNVLILPAALAALAACASPQPQDNCRARWVAGAPLIYGDNCPPPPERPAAGANDPDDPDRIQEPDPDREPDEPEEPAHEPDKPDEPDHEPEEPDHEPD